MPTESKKLQTYGNAIAAAAARISHELMDPARKTPETPLEREQREVIRKLDAQVAALANWVNAHDFNPAVNHLLMRAREARAAAAPFLED